VHGKQAMKGIENRTQTCLSRVLNFGKSEATQERRWLVTSLLNALGMLYSPAMAAGMMLRC
jgi:hypothetical protein